MGEIKWIKLSTDIFDNRKIKVIESMPDGDSLLIIWLKLITLAGHINDNGYVYFTQEIAYTDQLLATQFNRPLPTIQLALRTFEQFGMIELIDSVIHITNWEKYQNIEGMERIREQTRLRVAKHRETQKLSNGNVTSNVTVTQSNATDIDKNKKKNKNISSEIREIIDGYDDGLKTALEDFVTMRKSIKKPLTERALKIMLKKLEDITPDPVQQIKVLEQSIEHSWQTVYPLMSNTRGKIVLSNIEERKNDWEEVRKNIPNPLDEIGE